MTEDIGVLKDLVETLDNGKKGFADAADKLEGDGKSELAQQFRTYSEQRAGSAANCATSRPHVAKPSIPVGPFREQCTAVGWR